MIKIRYSTMRRLDVTNGPGVRSTIFVSGCTHNCEGCFNKELQSFSHGDLFTEEEEKVFLEYISNPVVVGVNILGGEPLQQTMDDTLLTLLRKIKKSFPEKPIWLWTGDIFEDAIVDPKKRELIETVDVVIDGRFQMDKRNIMLKYRGSSNQRVIDVKNTLENMKSIAESLDGLEKVEKDLITENISVIDVENL